MILPRKKAVRRNRYLFFRFGFWITLAGCVPSFSAIAQTPHTLWFHPLSARQGLAQSYNWYVYHDTEGFVWISSLSGLNRFDGVNVKQYNSIPGDSASLYGENIYSEFFEDKRKNIWFSTPGAIHCYLRKSDNFRHFFLRDETNQQIRGDYQAYFLEKDTFLWVGAGVIHGGGVYRFNIHRTGQPAEKIMETTQFRCRMGLGRDSTVNRVYAFGMSGGLEIHEIGNGRKEPRVLLKGSIITNLFPENDTLVWLTATGHGLLTLDPSEKGRAQVVWDDNTSSHMAAAPWGNNHLILLVRGHGLYLVEKSTGKSQPLACRFLNEKGDPVQSSKEIYVDRNSNLWVSDETSGLHYANLLKTKFRSLPKPPAGNNNLNYSYWAISETKGGDVWVGTSSGSVFVYDENNRLVRHYRHDPGRPGTLPPDRIVDIIQDNSNITWIASSGGVAWFDPNNGHFNLVPDEEGIKNGIFSHLHKTRDNRILVTAERGGIFEIINQEGEKRLARVLSADSGYFETIFEDKSGNLYCVRNSSQIGVFRFLTTGLTLVDSIEAGGQVTGFFEDDCNGVLYFATSNGLIQVAKDNLRASPVVYTEKDGLPGKFISGLETDANQHFWLGTNRGLTFFDREKFRAFSRADGVQSPEFHLTAVMKRSNGELWFGGSDGITIVPADGGFNLVKTPPKVVLTGIRINDENRDSLRCSETGATNIPEIKHLRLAYRDRTVSFEFVAIEYSDPSNNQLRYFLAGNDDKWVELDKGKPGFARYSKLPHGDYSLWLQGANSDGVWGLPQRVIRVDISPPFFLTWWFKTLLGLAFSWGVYAIYRNRIERIRKKEEMLRREAEVKQQMAETETAILRLQMNPHFIFNSMNSINAYILKKDIDTASEYLGRFAKLMRMILDSAARQFIPVSDEIDLLKLYLQTEAMRFEHKFTWSFEVEDSIDPDDVIIPTMILQPFVENAIWHGLANKKGGGEIKVSFKKENGLLLCSVEDNGIGREAALQIQNGRTHESKAMAITQRRLELLKKDEETVASCEVLDLKTPEGQARGTKIVLHLPFL